MLEAHQYGAGCYQSNESDVNMSIRGRQQSVRNGKAETDQTPHPAKKIPEGSGEDYRAINTRYTGTCQDMNTAWTSH